MGVAVGCGTIVPTGEGDGAPVIVAVGVALTTATGCDVSVVTGLPVSLPVAVTVGVVG